MINQILKSAIKYHRNKQKFYHRYLAWLEWLDSPTVKAGQASLSVGLGENVKCVDNNDTWQLQEMLADILSVLRTLQAENRKLNERLRDCRWKMKGL